MKAHSGLKVNNYLIMDTYNRGQKDFVSLYKKYISKMGDFGIFICTVKDFKQSYTDKYNNQHTIFDIVKYFEKIKTYSYIDKEKVDKLNFMINKINGFKEKIEGYNDTDMVCFKIDNSINNVINIVFKTTIYEVKTVFNYQNIEIIDMLSKCKNINRTLRFFKAIVENEKYSYNKLFETNRIPNIFETFFQRS